MRERITTRQSPFCTWTLTLLLVLAAMPSMAAQELVLDGQTWTTEGGEARLVDFQGLKAIYLKSARARLQGVSFENGTIEFDIAFPEERGFCGVEFRVQPEAGNYEHFYMRPHQSGKPDANQYTPVFHGNSGWQIYHGPGFGVPVRYRFDRWMRVRLVVAGSKADIYIAPEGDSPQPALHVPVLIRDPASGTIALSSNLVGAYFANVRIQPDAGARIVGSSDAKTELPPGLVGEWDVQGPVSYQSVTAAKSLSDLDLDDAAWKKLRVEPNGIANLGRVSARTQQTDTLFARLVIESDGERQRLLRFGYSDDVRVFVNGVPVYAGSNLYQSRDYRYLGTVGLFDALILPLKAGRNEIVFAVRENFGGWAIMAALEDAR